MGKTRAGTPWTWDQIAKFRGQQRLDFVRTYGVRGFVAMVVAVHLRGDLNSRTHRGYDYLICGMWRCAMCPMQTAVLENPKLTCYEAAMGVYARLIAERGRMPKEERR